MDFKDFYAKNDDDGRRLDRILKVLMPHSNLSEMYKAIRKGLIKINDKKCKSDSRVSLNDKISIAEFLLQSEKNTQDKSIKTENKLPPLPPVVFENENILILNKPYDMTVHGQNDSLDKIVLNYYEKNHKNDSLSFKPGPVHRIDKKTSGLVVFSMSLEGAQWFSENIRIHSIKKNYFALLQGKLTGDCTFEDYITNLEEEKNGFYKVESGNHIINKDSKAAVSHVKVLAHGKFKNQDVTFVKINIETGRKHQIRSQTAFHHHPLLGDTAYGGKRIENCKQDFFLQAAELIIPENPLGLPPKIQIDLSDNFKEFLTYCSIKN